MLKIVKASIGWLTKETQTSVAAQTDIVLDAMTLAKVNFPSPSPELGTIATANAALWVAINEAADGSREKRAIRDAKFAEVCSLMRQLAGYVTSTANGDMSKLISSGMPNQKPYRTKVGQLPTPATPKVTQGKDSGQANAATAKMKGASAYLWRVALASAPGVYVKTLQTTSSRAQIPGLAVGELYNVEVSAVGAEGPSNYSTPGQLRVI